MSKITKEEIIQLWCVMLRSPMVDIKTEYYHDFPIRILSLPMKYSLVLFGTGGYICMSGGVRYELTEEECGKLVMDFDQRDPKQFSFEEAVNMLVASNSPRIESLDNSLFKDKDK